MKKNRNLLVFVALIATMAFLVVGCGGSSDDNSSSNGTDTSSTAKPTETLKLAADPGGALAYTETSLKAKPGVAEIDFTNEAPIAHDVAIEAPDGKTIAQSDVITGSNTSFDVKLKPGKYTYYCTLPGHRAGGMEGTLTVK